MAPAIRSCASGTSIKRFATLPRASRSRLALVVPQWPTPLARRRTSRLRVCRFGDPKAPAVTRETEEDWRGKIPTTETVAPGHRGRFRLNGRQGSKESIELDGQSPESRVSDAD